MGFSDRRPRPLVLWALVATAILAISCASIFIRLADAPAVTIAFYRVAIAAALLAPGALPRRRWDLPGAASRPGPPSPPADGAAGTASNGAVSGPEPSSVATPASTAATAPTVAVGRAALHPAALTLAAGAFLAGHFLFWISSLQHTSVASSVALVSLSPLFAALISWVVLGERPERRLWCGLGLAILGSVAIAGIDFSLSMQSLYGDLLALGGALTAAGYLLCGRTLRRSMGIAAYASRVYGGAALLLGAAGLAAAAPFSGFSGRTWVFLILLALVPQLIGHTTFNWALRFLPATLVAVLTLGEPIGATVLAYLVLGETLTPAKGFGLGLLLAGIVLSSRGRAG